MYRYNGANTYTVRIPEYLRERMRRLAAFKQEYREEHHKEPRSEEIQRALNISRRSLVHLEKTMLNMQTKSLDEYVSNDGDTKLIDLLSTSEGIDRLVELSEYQRELHGELEEALSILDEKTSMLIRCVYYQQMNHSQTAEIFSCSRQNVSERINKGFYKILHSEYGKRLEGFMWDGYKAKTARLSDYVDMDIIDDKGSEFLL